MSNAIFLNLPDELYQQVETIARESHRDIQEILVETLAIALTNKTIQEQLISSTSESTDMMQLAETGFSEWNDPEEDIYHI